MSAHILTFPPMGTRGRILLAHDTEICGCFSTQLALHQTESESHLAMVALQDEAEKGGGIEGLLWTFLATGNPSLPRAVT